MNLISKLKSLFRKRIVFDAEKDESDTIYLKTMQKLEIKDGDILVFKFPYKVNSGVLINFSRHVKEKIKELGYDIEIIILEEGIDVGILRKG